MTLHIISSNIFLISYNIFMSRTIKYEMMILLTEEFNDSELKTWAFNYAKHLRKLNASEISVISRGKRDLAYRIADQKREFYSN